MPDEDVAHETFRFPGFVLDSPGRVLTDDEGREVPLTPSEFGLLEAFMRGAGRALSRDHLLQAVAGREAATFDRSIDVLVSRLRRKIEVDPKVPRLIVTVPGIGYKLTVRPAPGGAASPAAQIMPAAEVNWPALAVMPFANLSGDPDQDYFADGIVEDIITALSRVRWFFVIARNSSFTYKGREVDVTQVGRELRARYLLEGSVRKAGHRVRIAAQLIDAATARNIWADRFDGNLSDIFELQDRITERVVGAIEPNLQRAEIARAKAKPPQSLDAYDLYLRALAQYYTMTRSGTQGAIDLLQRAIRIDTGFTMAKATLAFVYIFRNTQGWSEPEDSVNAISLAREVLTIERDDPTILSLAGHALSHFAQDYEQARAAINRAVFLNPNGAQVFNKAGWVCLHQGDTDAAIDFFQRAMQRSPLDPEKGYMLAGLSCANLMAGHNEAGLTYALQAVEEAPTWASCYRYAILALVRHNRIDEARALADRALKDDPGRGAALFRAPFRHRHFVEECMAALRLAGVPE